MVFMTASLPIFPINRVSNIVAMMIDLKRKLLKKRLTIKKTRKTKINAGDRALRVHVRGRFHQL